MKLKIWVLLLMISAVMPCWAQNDAVMDAVRRAAYAYDASLPLKATTKTLDENARRTRYSLQYDSVHDQRVTAIFSLPKKVTLPVPAVIVMHGAGGHKDADYVRFASETLLAQGIATLTMDAQYRGDRARPGRTGDPNPASYVMRDAWIQTVIDLRRAVDYLSSRKEINKTQIGYLGFSMGGMFGAVLGGVEPRVAAFCLAVPGGGFVNLVKTIDKYPLLKAHWPVTVTPEVMRVVEENSQLIDPIHFAGKILPRPLLIMVGKNDEVIPAESSQALIDAARADEVKNVKRYNAGHALHPNVAFDIRDFFLAQFGKPASSSP
jgi:uncharacterized protein